MGSGERQLQSKQQHLIATFYTNQIFIQLLYKMKIIFLYSINCLLKYKCGKIEENMKKNQKALSSKNPSNRIKCVKIHLFQMTCSQNYSKYECEKEIECVQFQSSQKKQAQINGRIVEKYDTQQHQQSAATGNVNSSRIKLPTSR